ncbi:uncharacterized protein METZ01_LOCUS390677, partial [marine metagenome]
VQAFISHFKFTPENLIPTSRQVLNCCRLKHCLPFKVNHALGLLHIARRIERHQQYASHS